MKIRGRLIIAFLFITIFPLALIALCYNTILTNQASTLEDDYQSDISSENLLLNPIHILSTATMTDFRTLVHVADTNPDVLIRGIIWIMSTANFPTAILLLLYVKAVRSFISGTKRRISS